ncbi:archease [Marinitoga aeolica]|uniref:Archease n=1 Tax=Marinitoga aeolica TaxID=2809031 RepID=A0ABY8PRL2_9BACT|nr:archease [Marinitoga aeolica]WGS65262.1 archease [Marinitoga aeolica]
MSKELNHPADILFKLSGNTLGDMLEDLFDAFNKIFNPIVGGLKKEYIYNISKKEIDDIVFDIGNYSLNKIYEGFFPSKVEVINEDVKIYFSEIIELKGDMEIKAIAYPKVIEDENSISLKVIFDI